MMSIVSRVTVAAAITAAAGAVVLTSAVSASATATTVLGAPDIAAACANQHPGSTAGYSDSNNAYSWGCYNGGYVGGLNLNQQCTVQYGSPAYAKTDHPNDVWSWYCFR